MLPEDHVVEYSDDVVLVIWIAVIEEFKDLELHACLVLKFLLITYDLDSDMLPSLMIKTFDSLSKASRA